MKYDDQTGKISDLTPPEVYGDNRQFCCGKKTPNHTERCIHFKSVELAKAVSPGAAKRKGQPLATGVLDYFPQALIAVAELSRIGNDQHNPGQPLHWAREKSTDHADCILRHMVDRGTLDSDGVRHSAKVAWRALALLQTEIEKERK